MSDQELERRRNGDFCENCGADRGDGYCQECDADPDREHDRKYRPEYVDYQRELNDPFGY